MREREKIAHLLRRTGFGCERDSYQRALRLGYEGTVRDIQREVAGLATGLAQIQAAVKNGRPVAAAAPAPAAATAALFVQLLPRLLSSVDVVPR